MTKERKHSYQASMITSKCDVKWIPLDVILFNVDTIFLSRIPKSLSVTCRWNLSQNEIGDLRDSIGVNKVLDTYFVVWLRNVIMLRKVHDTYITIFTHNFRIVRKIPSPFEKKKQTKH